MDDYAYDFGYGDDGDASGYVPTNIASEPSPYDFWESIGINPDTTMENWQSPSNEQIEKALQGDATFTNLVRQYGSKALDMLKTNGKFDPAKLATLGVGAYSLMNRNETGGYNKPVPRMDMVREQIKYDDTGRRPGSMGRQYFTDARFVPQGDAGALEAARAASAEQAAGIRALQPAQAAPTVNPWAGKMNLAALRPAAAAPVAEQGVAQLPQIPEATGMAQGGIAAFAKGGRYLSGTTDGMADKIDTTIDDTQAAKLSHGEFVIPADVVSHLGNGNSDAGAKKLYEMMSRVRKARTGNEKQGKQIDPNKFVPGGIVGLASGGSVKGFSVGGSTGTTGSTGTSGVPLDTSRMSTLSPWAGDYVTGALGKGAAMAASPYQSYGGPLTAGPSDLQQQAFAGASEVAQTGFTPTQFTSGTFDTAAASRYMNPYLEAALAPQMDEMRRQAEIKRVEDAGRLTRAGAYGGGRQAIMESEGARNLLDLQNRTLGAGYATAYDKAMNQFNTEQGRQMEAQKATEASRQFGGEYGLKSLDFLSGLGKTQRDIEAEGIAADKAQFEAERDYAYKMPQYQLNLLQGIPTSASITSTDQSGLAGLQSQISGLASLYKTLSALGQAPTPKA